MQFLRYLPISLLLILCLSCKEQSKNLADKKVNLIDRIEKLNVEIKKGNKLIDSKLMTLFGAASDICTAHEMRNMLRDMSNEVFGNDDYKRINKLKKNLQPAIRLIVGGETFYLSPDVSFFLSKSNLESNSYEFFILARDGWYDKSTQVHGGENNFPKWMIQRTGIQGDYILKEVENYIDKWSILSNKLNGYYKEIALSTIKELQNAKSEISKINK